MRYLSSLALLAALEAGCGMRATIPTDGMFDTEGRPADLLLDTGGGAEIGLDISIDAAVEPKYKDCEETSQCPPGMSCVGKPCDGSSKLGLARMRFEGGVDLSIKREADGRVQVTACRHL